MSIPKRMTVNCPSCKRKIEATIFESLNTDFASDIIETVISGDCFSARCPHCGSVAHLEYDLLYHDMKHSAMIWVIHDDNPEYSKKVAEVRATHLLPNNVTRIVPDMNALREKAACLASGKDDRIVELCKVFLVSQVNQQMPDFNFRNAFYSYYSGRDIIFFYDIKGKEIRCNLDDKVYGVISDLFKRPLSQMERIPYQIIDYGWAVDFFNNLPNEGENEEMIAGQSERTNPSKADSTPITDNSVEVSLARKALFCRKCGAKLLSDSLFCSYCGTKVVY